MSERLLGLEAPRIGILAGMGPRSTAPFVDAVVTECQLQYGAVREDEFPAMMIYSLPTPFTFDADMDHDGVQSTILGGLRTLEETGIAFIAMPCNSAHLYHRALAAAIETPLLDMIEIAAADIAESVAAGPGSDTVALLATRLTRDAGLYGRALEGFGLTAMADDAAQDAVDRLLRDIHASPEPAALSDRWLEILAESSSAGHGAAVLACTDLNVVADPVADEAPLPVVDATRALAAATVRRWLELAREGAGTAA